MKRKRNAIDAIYEHEAEIKRKERKQEKEEERYFQCPICTRVFCGSKQHPPRCPTHTTYFNGIGILKGYISDSDNY